MEELQRRLDESEARTAAAETRAEEERARAEEERARAEEERARAEEERARADEATGRLADERAKTAAETARADEEKRRREALESTTQPTTFVEYIYGVEEHLYQTLEIGRDSTAQSKVGTTSVTGKFFPQHFRPWTDFEATHAEMFARFTDTFGEERYFRSLLGLDEGGRDLSPVPADEQDLRPFIRASIEKPAASIVSKYLELSHDANYSHVRFRNNAYGLLPPGEEEEAAAGIAAYAEAEGIRLDDDGTNDNRTGRSAKRRSPTKYGVADRWLYAFYQDRAAHGGQSKVNVLAGEYKAAHALSQEKLARVMGMPPGDDFFLQATGKSEDRKADDRAWTEGSMFVARVLCQAFHYMLTSGIEHGYVASGDGLVFLRVPEDDPNTLFYFWSVFPVGRQDEIRAPQETAMAYLATLCMCALRSRQRPLSWIESCDGRVERWSTSKEVPAALPDVPPPFLPRGPEDDNGGGGDVRGSGGGEELSGSATTAQLATSRGRRKRTRDQGTSSQQQQQQQRFKGPWIVEPPTLPYCTQACLRGLCQGLPLDKGCPNVALHRAAAQGGGGGGGMQDSDAEDGRHPLTAEAVRTRIVAQLAANLDKDAECLDAYGCFGRYGVLFKLAVTGFGYTFVGKAVHRINRHKLDHEVAVYARMQAFQGVLMPVCMGVIALARPVMLHSGTSVAYMMLLSHAGPDLGRPREAVPAGVDAAAEARRTVRELAKAGLLDSDGRDVNMTWNAEVKRVMRIDFGEAWLKERAKPVLRDDNKTDKTDTTDTTDMTDTTDTTDSTDLTDATSRSPLATKRDANAVAADHGPAAKRARREEDEPATRRTRAAL